MEGECMKGKGRRKVAFTNGTGWRVTCELYK